MTGPSVSFVVPVKNGARWLRDTVDAILAETRGRTAEVLVVDDGSTDGSMDLLTPYVAAGDVLLLRGPGRGAAAAVNLGIRHARGGIVCQVDQDVVLEPGWLAAILEPLADPRVAASQGWYLTPRDAGLCARVTGHDLEQRYGRLTAPYVDHVCTGNTAYRAAALRAVGLLDESLGYGYDNDLSYRLAAAGYRLAFARSARSVHRWREGPGGYLRQQYGVGYGRLDVIAKHPHRVGGDDVSGADMIGHAAAMLVAVLAALIALALAAVGGPWRAGLATAASIVAALAIERAIAGVRAARASGDRAPLAFPPLHLARDLAWCAAIAAWVSRRLAARPRRPAHSMSAP